jgi:RNA polymerase sigma-70 factor, ECF subfamily
MGEAEPSDFERFYVEQFGRVTRAAYLVLGSREEAFDVAQEAFARTWREWERVGRREEPLFFTLRVARNLSISRLRRWRTIACMPPLTVEAAPTTDQVEVRVAVRSAIRDLPPRQRWAVVLSDLLDLSSEHAAKVVGVAPSTLRVHLARGRARLRRMLGPETAPSHSTAWNERT